MAEQKKRQGLGGLVDEIKRIVTPSNLSASDRLIAAGNLVQPVNKAASDTVLRTLNLPFAALAGISREIRENPAQGLNPLNNPFGLKGAIKGIRDDYTLFEETPKLLGVKPDSPLGFGIGLGAEVLSPSVVGKVKIVKNAPKITKAVTELADNAKVRNVAESLVDAAKNTVKLEVPKPPLEVPKPPALSGAQPPKAPTSINVPPAGLRGADTKIDKANIVDYLRTPEDVFKKIGMQDQVDYVRRQFERYRAELPQEIDRITEWSKRASSPESARSIFQYLDGKKIDLDPNDLKIANEIKDYLKGWADRLGLPEDKRIASYITHIFEKDLIEKDFDEDIAKIIADKIPGSVYDPFLQKRLGTKGYIEDVWRALDAYVKRATRKANMDPALDEMKRVGERLDLESYNYVKKYGDMLNMRPTESDNLVDNFIKQTPVGYKLGQRPVALVTQASRQTVARSMLGLNVGSAIRNLTQGTNTYAKLGEKYTTLGYMDILKRLASNDLDELKRVQVLDDAIIQDRQLSAVKKFWEKTDNVLFSLFNTVEKINRGAAYFGAKRMALGKGLREEAAIEFAKKLVRDTQFSFSKVDTPVALASDITKTLLQFQTYNIKQVEFLGKMLANKEYAGVIRWVAANMVIAGTIGQVLGINSFLDQVPFANIFTDEGKLPKPPVQTLLDPVLKGVTGQYNENPDLLGRDVSRATRLLIPAGSQIQKSVTGAQVISDDGYLDYRGRLRYPIGDELDTRIRAVVFGPNNTDAAQLYYNEKLTPLSQKETQAWKNAVDQGADPEQAWVSLYKQKAAYSLNSDISRISRDIQLTPDERQQELKKLQQEYQETINKLDEFSGGKSVEPQTNSDQSSGLRLPPNKPITPKVTVKKGKAGSLRTPKLKIAKTKRSERVARLKPVLDKSPRIRISRNKDNPLKGVIV